MKLRNFITLISALCAVGMAHAQQAGSNDLGFTPVPGSSASSSPISPAALLPGYTCPVAGSIASGFDGSQTQLGRIFRDGVASTCPGKTYPGIFNAGTTYNYTTATYANTSTSAMCVTVNFDTSTGATPCDVNAHMSAYLNTYDPNDQATNFVGDVGSSVTQPFSFSVPAQTNLVLVTTNTLSQANCSFSYEVVNLPCSQIPQAVPTLNPVGMALLLLTMLLGSTVVGRKRS